MVIGDFLGYSSLGFGGLPQQRPSVQERPSVTLDAQIDPKVPNEYAVPLTPKIIPPPERPSEVIVPDKRTSRSNDPVSRAFLTVANYQPIVNKINITV